MPTEDVGLGGLGSDLNRGRGAGDRRMLKPERAIVGLAITGGAEIEADALDDALDVLGAEEGPHLGLGHVDEADRRLVLVGAGASARVFGSREDAAGDDEVVGAARAEAAEVSRAAVV